MVYVLYVRCVCVMCHLCSVCVKVCVVCVTIIPSFRSGRPPPPLFVHADRERLSSLGRLSVGSGSSRESGSSVPGLRSRAVGNISLDRTRIGGRTRRDTETHTPPRPVPRPLSPRSGLTKGGGVDCPGRASLPTYSSVQIRDSTTEKKEGGIY